MRDAMAQTETYVIARLTGESSPVSGDAVAPLRVLVVDDEDLVRRVIGTLLRRAGFEVDEARDGLEALACLRTALPDLVLTDLDMPRCTGEELCAAIKRDHATTHIPVLLMTGGQADESRMRAAGCSAVLYKPLPPSLTRWIARSIEDARKSRG
jgi:CheY-like chemotaxis protein